jgi:sugar phosphate isomerase/epimerase
MRLSVVTASYVADLLGYSGEIDWALASQRMQQAPLLGTIDGMVERLAPAHLEGIELYYPHVWPARLTPALATAIRRRLSAARLVCCACAGGMPDPAADPDAAEELFQTARLLQAPVIAGHTHFEDPEALTALCKQYGIRLGYENGAECDAGEILEAIQGGNEWIGANIDTGNMASQGGDPVRAIRELGSRIIHVHLKDVREVGSHECVEIGTGIVDVPGVLDALQSVGYDGWLSIEIETADHDPTDDIIASAARLGRLLAAS